MSTLSLNSTNSLNILKSKTLQDSKANEVKSELFSARSRSNNSNQQYLLFQTAARSQQLTLNNALQLFNTSNDTQNSLNNSLNSINSVIGNLVNNISSLENKIFEQDSQLSGLKASVESNNASINEKTAQRNNVMAQKTNYFSTISNFDGQINGITNQITTIDGQISEASAPGTIQRPVLDVNGQQTLDEQGNPVFETENIEPDAAMIENLQQQKIDLQNQQNEIEKQRADFIAVNSDDFDGKMAALTDSIGQLEGANQVLFLEIDKVLQGKYNLNLAELESREKLDTNVVSKAYLESQIKVYDKKIEADFAKYTTELEKSDEINKPLDNSSEEKSINEYKLQALMRTANQLEKPEEENRGFMA